MFNQDLNESQRQAGKGPQPNVISKRTAELLRARYAMSEIYKLAYATLTAYSGGSEKEAETLLYNDEETGFFPFFNKTSDLIEAELIENILSTMEKTGGKEI